MTDSAEWLLSPEERGNPATDLPPWTEGNLAVPLVHGAAYFDELVRAVEVLDEGDHLFFTDWRGDPDEELRPGGSSVICAAWSSSSSVVSPIAETTTTTSLPAVFSATMRSATRLMWAAEATEEPPYFCTTRATGPQATDAERRPPTPRPCAPPLRPRGPRDVIAG